MFKNEPFTDFTISEERAKLTKALAELSERLRKGPLSAAPLVNGETVPHGQVFEREDPSDGVTLISRTRFADAALTQRAIEGLRASLPSWESTPTGERADILRKAAALMRARRHALSALIIREAGKPWREADADVAEAIDFCDYYADEAVRCLTPRLTMPVPGEDNHYFYQPRGVCAVIAPWNFPLAIACGMTTAALVCGNTVALKPAEQTSLIARELVNILLEAGIPPRCLAFLPGIGEEVGRTLVQHPKVDMVVFTGSKAVGLEIIRSCAEVRPGQASIKRVVAELGGKNAIIVDSDADIDEAIKGILYSTFGFSGQKCSACSRLIVVGDAYEPLLHRLAAAAQSILIGPASDSATLVGPVIDAESQKRILGVIKSGEHEQQVLFKGSVPERGYFVPPTIFRDVSPQSSLWTEEIFGPVLACLRARDFDEALELANRSQYALTGGVFSRSPENLSKARREFRVGNLYLNRGCTGALVCRQPFGGFRMSGVGSKAGGPDYLLQFVEPRTVSENTMRRGFAPAT
jgi:RHH-type proline utilization regulon transcriptional repressor/proline dehydrogenase/delta 1-pyrroline-5-carboxylate dehydrogenase